MRYTIGIIAIMIIAVFATIFTVGRARGPQSDDRPKTVHAADYAAKPDSSVSWTQEGKLVGSTERRAVRITVTPARRTAEIIEGYNGKVMKSIDLPNDAAAYSTLMLALERLRFGKERTTDNPDERGACPLGYRYIYEIYDAGTIKSRLWSTSCRNGDGTFDGVATDTRQVFKNQIPEYDKFIAGVKL